MFIVLVLTNNKQQTKTMQFYLAATRFNNLTYQENIGYREKYGEICVYGSSFKIREIYPSGCLIFVAEMNNETNKIEGIGLIRNTLAVNGKQKIYGQYEYNRFIYKGNHWLSREQLAAHDELIIEILDTVLFKGKSHLKRRSGITIITPLLFTNWDYDLDSLKQKIRSAFLYHFCTNNDLVSNLVNNLDLGNTQPQNSLENVAFEVVDEEIEVVS